MSNRRKLYRGSPTLLRKGGVHADQPKRGHRPQYEPTIDEQFEQMEFDDELEQEYTALYELDGWGDE